MISNDGGLHNEAMDLDGTQKNGGTNERDI